MTHRIYCVELGNVAVPGMRIKVRWFPDGAQETKAWRAPSNILSLRRIVGEPVQHRDLSTHSSSFHSAGPLTFWPRSAVWESQRSYSPVLAVSAYFDTNFPAATVDRRPEGILVEDFSMLEMMQILHDEVRMPGEGSQDLVSAIGNVLRIKLSRLTSQRQRNPSIGKPCRSVDVAMIHSLVTTTGGHRPTTAGLAEKLHTSRRNLLRLFQATTGMSPSCYIDESMLDKAKALLATSQMTMKQIAYEAGYSTASHFSTKFRRLTGLTPSAFRRGARRQDRLHPVGGESRNDERQD
jgi:AraC-like DNA-binding protein